MSCVAELKAMSAKKARDRLTNESDESDMASSANDAPPRICVVTTKNFLVLKLSMKPLHSGFSDHGQATREVKAAICVSERPRLLYMSTDTVIVATKGRPSAM